MMIKYSKVFNSSLFKYGLASAGALSIDIATITIAKEILNLNSIISATLGFIMGLLFIYFISVKYIFGRSDYSRSFEISIFIIIGIIGLIINDVIIMTLDPISNIYIAKFVAIWIVFTWNFLARRKLMTKKEQQNV